MIYYPLSSIPEISMIADPDDQKENVVDEEGAVDGQLDDSFSRALARAEDAIRTDEEMSKVMANIEDYYRGVRDDIEKLEFKAERKYLQERKQLEAQRDNSEDYRKALQTLKQKRDDDLRRIRPVMKAIRKKQRALKEKLAPAPQELPAGPAEPAAAAAPPASRIPAAAGLGRIPGTSGIPRAPTGDVSAKASTVTLIRKPSIKSSKSGMVLPSKLPPRASLPGPSGLRRPAATARASIGGPLGRPSRSKIPAAPKGPQAPAVPDADAIQKARAFSKMDEGFASESNKLRSQYERDIALAKSQIQDPAQLKIRIDQIVEDYKKKTLGLHVEMKKGYDQRQREIAPDRPSLASPPRTSPVRQPISGRPSGIPRGPSGIPRGPSGIPAGPARVASPVAGPSRPRSPSRAQSLGGPLSGAPSFSMVPRLSGIPPPSRGWHAERKQRLTLKKSKPLDPRLKQFLETYRPAAAAPLESRTASQKYIAGTDLVRLRAKAKQEYERAVAGVRRVIPEGEQLDAEIEERQRQYKQKLDLINKLDNRKLAVKSKYLKDVERVRGTIENQELMQQELETLRSQLISDLAQLEIEAGQEEPEVRGITEREIAQEVARAEKLAQRAQRLRKEKEEAAAAEKAKEEAKKAIAVEARKSLARAKKDAGIPQPVQPALPVKTATQKYVGVDPMARKTKAKQEYDRAVAEAKEEIINKEELAEELEFLKLEYESKLDAIKNHEKNLLKLKSEYMQAVQQVREAPREPTVVEREVKALKAQLMANLQRYDVDAAGEGGQWGFVEDQQIAAELARAERYAKMAEDAKARKKLAAEQAKQAAEEKQRAAEKAAEIARKAKEAREAAAAKALAARKKKAAAERAAAAAAAAAGPAAEPVAGPAPRPGAARPGPAPRARSVPRLQGPAAVRPPPQRARTVGPPERPQPRAAPPKRRPPPARQEQKPPPKPVPRKASEKYVGGLSVFDRKKKAKQEYERDVAYAKQHTHKDDLKEELEYLESEYMSKLEAIHQHEKNKLKLKASYMSAIKEVKEAQQDPDALQRELQGLKVQLIADLQRYDKDAAGEGAAVQNIEDKLIEAEVVRAERAAKKAEEQRKKKKEEAAAAKAAAAEKAAAAAKAAEEAAAAKAARVAARAKALRAGRPRVPGEGPPGGAPRVGAPGGPPGGGPGRPPGGPRRGPPGGAPGGPPGGIPRGAPRGAGPGGAPRGPPGRVARPAGPAPRAKTAPKPGRPILAREPAPQALTVGRAKDKYKRMILKKKEADPRLKKFLEGYRPAQPVKVAARTASQKYMAGTDIVKLKAKAKQAMIQALNHAKNTSLTPEALAERTKAIKDKYQARMDFIDKMESEKDKAKSQYLADVEETRKSIAEPALRERALDELRERLATILADLDTQAGAEPGQIVPIDHKEIARQVARNKRLAQRAEVQKRARKAAEAAAAALAAKVARSKVSLAPRRPAAPAKPAEPWVARLATGAPKAKTTPRKEVRRGRVPDARSVKAKPPPPAVSAPRLVLKKKELDPRLKEFLEEKKKAAAAMVKPKPVAKKASEKYIAAPPDVDVNELRRKAKEEFEEQKRLLREEVANDKEYEEEVAFLEMEHASKMHYINNMESYKTMLQNKYYNDVAAAKKTIKDNDMLKEHLQGMREQLANNMAFVEEAAGAQRRPGIRSPEAAARSRISDVIRQTLRPSTPPGRPSLAAAPGRIPKPRRIGDVIAKGPGKAPSGRPSLARIPEGRRVPAPGTAPKPAPRAARPAPRPPAPAPRAAGRPLAARPSAKSLPAPDKPKVEKSMKAAPAKTPRVPPPKPAPKTEPRIKAAERREAMRKKTDLPENFQRLLEEAAKKPTPEEASKFEAELNYYRGLAKLRYQQDYDHGVTKIRNQDRLGEYLDKIKKEYKTQLAFISKLPEKRRAIEDQYTLACAAANEAYKDDENERNLRLEAAKAEHKAKLEQLNEEATSHRPFVPDQKYEELTRRLSRQLLREVRPPAPPPEALPPGAAPPAPGRKSLPASRRPPPAPRGAATERRRSLVESRKSVVGRARSVPPPRKDSPEGKKPERKRPVAEPRKAVPERRKPAPEGKKAPPPRRAVTEPRKPLPAKSRARPPPPKAKSIEPVHMKGKSVEQAQDKSPEGAAKNWRVPKKTKDMMIKKKRLVQALEEVRKEIPTNKDLIKAAEKGERLSVPMSKSSLQTIGKRIGLAPIKETEEVAKKAKKQVPAMRRKLASVPPTAAGTAQQKEQATKSPLASQEADGIFRMMMDEAEGIDLNKQPGEIVKLIVPSEGPTLAITGNAVESLSKGVITDQIPVKEINVMSDKNAEEFASTVKQQPPHKFPIESIASKRLSPERIVVEPAAEPVPKDNFIQHDVLLHSFQVETFFQARGSVFPKCFPGIYTVFPEENPKLVLKKSPSEILYRAWQILKPKYASKSP
ncbi:unnamed protein product [Hermetia illucens]|uniref:Uncharacterized protein n=1 Tax=Hermetia illucens TaxID=343691 RepID=A0A7R8UHL1_HERIL|nr:unnamed protein product [Hermetia illucens]